MKFLMILEGSGMVKEKNLLNFGGDLGPLGK